MIYFEEGAKLIAEAMRVKDGFNLEVVLVPMHVRYENSIFIRYSVLY